MSKRPMEDEKDKTSTASSNIVDIFIPQWTPERLAGFQQYVCNTKLDAEKESITVLHRAFTDTRNGKGLAPVYGPLGDAVVQVLRTKGYGAKLVEHSQVEIDFSTIVQSSMSAPEQSVIQSVVPYAYRTKKVREAMEEIEIMSIALKKEIFVGGVFELKANTYLGHHFNTAGPPLMLLLKAACQMYNGRVTIDSSLVEDFVHLMKYIGTYTGSSRHAVVRSNHAVICPSRHHTQGHPVYKGYLCDVFRMVDTES